MNPTSATLELPAWLADVVRAPISLPVAATENSDAARMLWAIKLAERNVAEKTGGPFAAIIVEETTGQCVAAGVNLVVNSGLSIAHAEAVAIMLAQLRVKTFDLAGKPPLRHTLYATGQPCIMCFGVLWWSGVTKLVCGARGEDVESITSFREGPLPANWPELLTKRRDLPIEVIRDVERDAACNVLRQYMASGQPVYNPGSTA